MANRLGCIALLACAVAAAAHAQPAQTRQFAIPGHGSLVLEVPKGWRVAERSTDEPPSASLQMGPAPGGGLVLQVTAVWLDAEKRRSTARDMKANVQKTADGMLSEAVEKQATVVELRGREAHGYHFSLTDRSSKNAGGDYRYATQGTLATGELIVIFTLLHRDPAPREKPQVLQLLADARHSAEAAPPRRDALQIRDLGQSYELSVPVSRLVMTVPKSAIGAAKRQPAGNDHPRYFYFSGGGLNVSGWFEPASGFRGIKPFWEQETAAWEKRGLPPPVDTTFSRIGQWDAVIYDVAFPSGSNSHIRAHWVQAGTWIDIHLSLSANRPSAETRAQLSELLKRIAVRERN